MKNMKMESCMIYEFLYPVQRAFTVVSSAMYRLVIKSETKSITEYRLS